MMLSGSVEVASPLMRRALRKKKMVSIYQLTVFVCLHGENGTVRWLQGNIWTVVVFGIGIIMERRDPLFNANPQHVETTVLLTCLLFAPLQTKGKEALGLSCAADSIHLHISVMKALANFSRIISKEAQRFAERYSTTD